MGALHPDCCSAPAVLNLWLLVDGGCLSRKFAPPKLIPKVGSKLELFVKFVTNEALCYTRFDYFYLCFLEPVQ